MDYDGIEKRKHINERKALVKQLTPHERQVYRKNRWSIFKKSYFEEMGCGCFFGFILGIMLIWMSLSKGTFSWKYIPILAISVWLLTLLFYPLCSVWDTRIQNEIQFLKKLEKKRINSKSEAVRQFTCLLKQIAEEKAKTSSDDIIFISKK